MPAAPIQCRRRKEERTDESRRQKAEVQKSEVAQSTCARAVVCSGTGRLAGGCAVGPNYKRPAVDSPAAFRTRRVGHQRSRRHELLRQPRLVAGVSRSATDGLHRRGADEQLGHQDRRRPRAAGRSGLAHHPLAVLPHRQRRRRPRHQPRLGKRGRIRSDRRESAAGLRRRLRLHARLRAGSLGHDPPRERGRPRPVARDREARRTRCARRWSRRWPRPISICWNSTTNSKSPSAPTRSAPTRSP